jgi:pseudouridine synthase
MTGVRLQKYLSEAGYCSRRQGEVLILSGRVRVNGAVVSVLGTRIDPEKDRVEVEGCLLTVTEKRLYIALNKPPGIVTSCRHAGKRIVMDLLDLPQRVYPIGRLDEDSQGLILLTNDGPLHHRLSHPSFDHEKEYDVTVTYPLKKEALDQLSKGIVLQGRKTRSAMVTRISAVRFRIILKEGRNRQIRRMIEQLGNRVIKLERVRISGVRLGRLPLGQWRYLSTEEIRTLTEM